VVIVEERVAEVLDPLPAGTLWGVGPAAVRRLAALGIHTIGELRGAPRESIVRVFGNAADHYLELANGRDERSVVVERDPKSMGQERTFPTDVEDPDELGAVLLGQVEGVARRLRAHGLEARTVTLKLRSGDFTTRTRSKTLPEPTGVTEDLWRAASALFAAWARSGAAPLRLLGFSVSNVSVAGGGEGSLLPDSDRGRGRQLDRAIDRIAERFGSDAVRRASARSRRDEKR
jgi:DNA polymerase-4